MCHLHSCRIQTCVICISQKPLSHIFPMVQKIFQTLNIEVCWSSNNKKWREHIKPPLRCIYNVQLLFPIIRSMRLTSSDIYNTWPPDLRHQSGTFEKVTVGSFSTCTWWVEKVQQTWQVPNQIFKTNNNDVIGVSILTAV